MKSTQKGDATKRLMTKLIEEYGDSNKELLKDLIELKTQLEEKESQKNLVECAIYYTKIATLIKFILDLINNN